MEGRRSGFVAIARPHEALCHNLRLGIATTHIPGQAWELWAVQRFPFSQKQGISIGVSVQDEQLVGKPEAASFWDALLYWLKLGFISFGGPAGQISMMHQELVEKRRWISDHRFLRALNYTMVLPGPEAQQLATYIRWLMHGAWGGIAAGVLFALPSLFILAGLTWIYLAYGDVPVVAGILYGIKPAGIMPVPRVPTARH